MSNHDSVQKFLLESSNVRGVIATLDETCHTILSQHAYPKSVQRLLGEVLIAAGLLAATIKLKGRMTIQFQSEGAIKLLVAQINDQWHLRGLAQWEVDALTDELENGFQEGHLVITVFQTDLENPLQSIVPLENGTVATALARYFLQSEQLPTQFYFSIQDGFAAGMLLQMMPEKAGIDRQPLWRNLMTHMQLFDQGMMNNTEHAALLTLQFPNENVRLFDAQPIQFRCSCTIEKMKSAIFTMGEAEANVILKNKREIVVTCEYCNHQYGFDKEAVVEIFKESSP